MNLDEELLLYSFYGIELGNLGLTREEEYIMQLILETHTAYIRLPGVAANADEVQRFMHAVHEIQYILGRRVLRREHNGWR